MEPGSVLGMILGEGSESGVADSDDAGDSEEMEVSGGVFKLIPVKLKGGSWSRSSESKGRMGLRVGSMRLGQYSSLLRVSDEIIGLKGHGK